MGGQKFQYDESGGTFFYFLLSFLALLLIPGTYYWWPRKQKQDPDKSSKECHCDGCKRKKQILQTSEPWKGTKQFLIKCFIVGGWIIFFFLAYKVSQFDYEYANFDPYEILGVPLGASEATIKKAYRKQSLVLHPDKETGNEKAFMKLTKAYQALTVEESRQNWEKYGNPDGPGAMSFGIALPSWIVEKENSVWVLGLYALVFMVALPTVVGTWWYRSIRYTGDQVLLDTTQMYYFFFHKTPSMPQKRVLMILAASLEFEKKYNSEIVERQSDNEEVPYLIKQFSNLGEKNKERPLCFMYSIKARALLFAHLSRLPLNPVTLDKDRLYIVAKCPYLIQEMVNCVSQLIMLGYARRVHQVIRIETIENCMKLCPMIVQAMWECKSPFLQLPHVTEDNSSKLSKRVRSIKELAELNSDEQRSLLRHFTEEQFSDVIKVVAKMPLIEFQVRTEVVDDEASTVITAGAIVTVTCTVIRQDMSVKFGTRVTRPKHISHDTTTTGANDKKEQQPKEKRREWQKQQKKGKKTGKKKVPTKKLPTKDITKQNDASKDKSDQNSIEKSEDNDDKSEKKKEKVLGQGDRSDADESDLSDNEVDKSEDEESLAKGKKAPPLEEDDDDWDRFQSGIGKRDRVLEGRSKMSHSVHCPYFPEDKQEYWWVYVCDRKSKTLLTSPFHITNLVDREEVQLKFTAPKWPGVFTFTVWLRSDSYLGFDRSEEIKLDVKEAPEVPTEHPQWDLSEEEEESRPEGEASDISEFTTDEDVED